MIKGDGMTATATTGGASEKQRAFFQTLMSERMTHPEQAEGRLVMFEAFDACETPKEASAIITALLQVKRDQTTTNAPKPEFEDGYYAANIDGTLKFYRLATSKKSGFQFVNRFRSDWLDKVYKAEAIKVRAEIRKSPEAARDLFAAETVCCYRCGRRLTDPTSRALGIGPDCRSL